MTHSRPVERVDSSVGDDARRLREFHRKTRQMITSVTNTDTMTTGPSTGE